MICPFCQSDNPAQAQFCFACGVELGVAATPLGQTPQTTADALLVGTLLAGTYAIERVLGQGGFGITYCCHDQMLDRRVAIKEFFPSGCRREASDVTPSRALTGTHFSEARAQFLAEARLLARCHHAGIVSVHTAFEANQTAYMVMEMLHGRDLSQLLHARGGRLSEAEAVPLIERAGAALQFVHETGLLHRDIKPENIIVCDDGRVMLIDFGTAREFVKGQSQGHTIVVTPGYAPLEQYARQAKRGAFTDVYGLAATLYHLLTGSAPPAASDRAMGVRLRPVREENSQISRSVAHAVEVALQMEIARRPQSVRAFLDLMRAPEAALPHLASAAQTALAPQRPTAGHSLAGKALLGEEEEALDEAEMARQTAAGFSPLFLPTELEARRQMFAALRHDPAPVQLAPPTPFPGSTPGGTPGGTPGALPKPNASLPMTSGTTPQMSPNTTPGYATRNVPAPDNTAQWAFAVAVVFFVGLVGVVSYNSSQPHNTPPTYVSGSGSSISSSIPSSSTSDSFARPPMALNRSETAARQEVDSTPAILPASVEILPDNETSPDKTQASGALSPGVAAFSPDGQRLAYVDRGGVVRVWNLATHQVVRTLPQSPNHLPLVLLFSSDSQNLAVTYQNQSGSKNAEEVQLWNLRTGKAGRTLSVDARKEWICAESVLPDGKALIYKLALQASPHPGLTRFLWDTNTGKQSPTPAEISSNMSQVVLSPDGKQFVTGDGEGRLRWLDARTGAQKSERRVSLTYGDLAVSEFSTGNNSSVVNSATPLPIEALRFSSDGSALAMRNKMQISIFNAKGGEIRTLPAAYAPEFAVSRGGSFLAESGTWKGEINNLLWDLREGRKTRLQGPPGNLSALNFSPDGKQVRGLSATNDRISLVTWNVDAKPLAPFSAPQVGISLPASSLFSSVVSAASQRVATSNGSNIEIYGFDGSLISNANAGGTINSRLTFSPDGRLLSFGLTSGEARVLDALTGKLVGQLNAMEAPQTPFKRDLTAGRSQRLGRFATNQLVFSADNRLLARIKGNENETRIELWRLGKEPRRLASLALTEPVAAIAVSQDNKSLICGGLDGTVRWYDVATQKLQGQIRSEGRSGEGSSGNAIIGQIWASQIVATAQHLTMVIGKGRTIMVRRYEAQPVAKTPNHDSKAAAADRKFGFSPQKEFQIPLRSLNPYRSQVALSSDGEFLVAENAVGTSGNGAALRFLQSGLAVWNVATGAVVQELPFSSSGADVTPSFLSVIRALSVSPDLSQVTCIRDDERQRQSQIITWRRPPARQLN